MSHQDEIVDLIIIKYNPKLSREKLYYEAAELNKIILPEYVELGHMNPGRWAKIAETHQKFGLLKENFSVNKFIYTPSDNSNNIYNTLIALLLIAIGILSLGLIDFVKFSPEPKLGLSCGISLIINNTYLYIIFLIKTHHFHN